MTVAAGSENAGPQKATRVVAVIPHWNRKDLLAELLPNLAAQTRLFDETVVVDNGSTDGSATFATDQGASVIRFSRNHGFAAAVNRGIEHALETSADFIAILNNDVRLEPDWLAVLLNTISKGPGKAWFASGKIVSAQDPSILDGTFDAISQGATALRCGAGKPDGPYWKLQRKMRLAPMTAALFRAEVFERVGLLDEQYGSYLEDVDFGIRCMKAGLEGIWNPAAVAQHWGSATWGRWHPATVRKLARNQILLARKHFQGMSRAPIVVGQLLWGLIALKHGCSSAYWEGRREGGRLQLAAGVAATPQFRKSIRESEQEIREVQSATGFDWYWRIYFWLLRP